MMTHTTEPQAQKVTRSVLIVDDHAIVRRGLRELLSREPDLVVIGEAGTSSEALEVARQQHPDLVLLDISMPGESGLGLLKHLCDDSRVLVLSMHDETLYAERALTAGASGYVAKYEPVDALLEAIRSVLDGKLYVSKNVTERLLHRLAGPARDRTQDALGELSDRELEIFRMIGNGMSTREIAESLHVSRKTIETHRENIKRKLNLRSGNELVVRATAWMLEQS